MEITRIKTQEYPETQLGDWTLEGLAAEYGVELDDVDSFWLDSLEAGEMVCLAEGVYIGK